MYVFYLQKDSQLSIYPSEVSRISTPLIHIIKSFNLTKACGWANFGHPPNTSRHKLIASQMYMRQIYDFLGRELRWFWELRLARRGLSSFSNDDTILRSISAIVGWKLISKVQIIFAGERRPKFEAQYNLLKSGTRPWKSTNLCWVRWGLPRMSEQIDGTYLWCYETFRGFRILMTALFTPPVLFTSTGQLSSKQRLWALS